MSQQPVQASGYFGAVEPKDPDEDIITRQRLGRDRSAAGAPRRRPKDLWFVGYVLDNMLPLFLTLLLAMGAGVVAFMAWSWTSDAEGGRSVAAVAGAGELPILGEPRGRGSYAVGDELSASERLAASRFGRPLYLGDGGFPVIEVYHTGEVREMTEMEAGFPSSGPLSVDYDDVPGLAPGLRRYEAPELDHPDVYFHPGPGGDGVWWHDPGRASSSGHVTFVDREGWHGVQMESLQDALPAVEQVLLSYQETDFSASFDTWVVEVHDEMERLTERYVGGDHGDWAMVSYRVSCDEQLELEKSGGLTRGCPSPLLEQALSYMWARYGKLVHSLWALSRVNHPDFRGYYSRDVQSTGVYFKRYSDRLIDESGLLTASFRDVIYIAASEGFNFSGVSWLGYPEVLLDSRNVIDY